MPSDPSGVLHYARCPECSAVYLSGVSEIAERDARECCLADEQQDTARESDT